MIIGVSTWLVLFVLRYGSREKDLPPGPPTIPVLGNAHLMSKNLYLKSAPIIHFPLIQINDIRRLKDWADQYGEVFSLKVGRKTIIVLNSRRTIYELFDKKGFLCTDRPNDEQLDLAMG